MNPYRQSETVFLKKFMVSILLIFLVSLNITKVSAQQFPVQATTVVTPPYSIFLSDYASIESNSLQLILNLLDLDRNQYRAKLRLTITGNEITIRTRESYSPPPIVIQGGIPETLTGFDLRNYFDPDNLEFNGITRQEFIRSGALPEGFYTFTFEVLDFNRNVVVSNQAMANAWLVLNDPPIINLPFNGDKVRAQEPQNVLFSWTPLHTASPNAAFNTEYEFRLVELYPTGRNPNDAILASNPIFTTTTSNTSLNYGITEPLLIPGRKYAFRIKAFDTSGRDLFKNNGFSEVFVFQFGDECLQPQNISAEALDESRIKIEWEGQEIHTEYDVRYRVEGSNDWFTENTFLDEQVIPDLNGSTTYEYQVRGKCSSILGPYSTTNTVSTPEQNLDQFICGSDIPEIELETTPIDAPINVGDQIQIADFDVTLTDIAANGDGTFKGTGTTPVPYFELASLEVKFDSIRINKEFRVYEGNITTVYNPNSSNIWPKESDEEKDLKQEDDGDNSEEDGSEEDTGDGLPSGEEVPIDTSYVTTDDIVDVKVDEDGKIVITLGDGSTDTIDPDDDGQTDLVDGDGDVITVDGDGNISGLGGDEVADSGTGEDGAESSESSVISIGPASIYFVEGSPPTPVSDQIDNEGYLTYQNIITEKVSLTANDDNVGSYDYELLGATVSFKQNPANQTYKEISIDWVKPTDGTGIDFDRPVILFNTSIELADIAIDEDGKISGSLDLKPNLLEDQIINDVYLLKSQSYNNFNFNYLNENNANGTFDLSEFNNIQIDIVKSNVVIASMTDGNLTADGAISGNFNMPNGPPPSFSNDQFTTTVNNVNLSVNYTTELSLNGIISVTLSDFQTGGPISGSLSFDINYEGTSDGSTSDLTGNISAFGMALSNYNVNVTYDQKYDLTNISGSLTAVHPDFSEGNIEVNDFTYSQLNGLEVFTGSGDFDYEHSGDNPLPEYTFNLQTTSYAPSEEKLNLDAVVTQAGENGAAGVAKPALGFSIANNGVISLQDLGDAGEADVVLGPIVVSFPSDSDFRDRNGGRLNGKPTRSITSRNNKANITLKAILPGGNEITKTLSGVDVTYRRYNARTDKSLISATVNWSGTKDFTPIWGISSSLTSVNIVIDKDGNLLSEDEDGNQLGLTLSASLEEDKVIKDVFKIKSGLSGDIKYQFTGANSFAGNFDLSNIQNINVVLEKNNQELAKIENGSFNNQGVFTGTFVKSQTNTFQSNAFDVSLDAINFNASYSFPDASFTFNSGTAGMSVSNINGLDDGSNLVFELSYDEEQNYTANITSASLSAVGFTFNADNLVAEFTSQFELIRFSGAISGSHADLGANLNVSRFLIEEGELKALNIEGDINYQGYNFTLSNTTYENNILNVNADLALNLTGTSASFGVSDFKVAPTGVSLGGVNGSFSQGNVVDVSFSATFGQSRFTGTFDADINALGLDVRGDIDIGKESDYYFAYLNLSAGLGVGVPLGPTGLKITELGGRLGFNYKLTYNQSSNAFVGDPKQGNYVMGFTLGLADAAGIVEVVGSPIIQFSSSSFDFGLIGQLSIPKNNPLLTSNLTLNYSYPAKTFAGSLTTDLKVPQGTGSIFNANATLNFAVANNKWNLTGNPINGSILSVVNFDGNFNFEGDVDPFRISTIALNGQANFDFNRSYTLDVSYLPFTITAGAEAHFNSYINATLNESGLNGEFGVNLSGRAYLQLRSTLYDFDLEAQITASGQVGYANGTGYVHGTVDIPVTVLTYDVNVPVKVDYNFNGSNSNSLVADGDGSNNNSGGTSNETFRQRIVRLNYSNLLTKYDALGNVQKAQFENDFNGTDDRKLKRFNDREHYVNAWSRIQNNIGSGTAFARDFLVLQALHNILGDASAMQAFSNQRIGGINNFISKYNDVRCGTCPNTGGYKTYMPTLDKILDNSSYSLKEFISKMDSKMFGQELITSNYRGRDGIQHMFKDMKSKGYRNADIDAIGANFTNSTNSYDVKFTSRKSLEYAEYKSYKLSGIGSSAQITQFLEYLKNISKLNELEYVFNGSKATKSQVKSKFKTIFKNRYSDIWKAKSSLFTNIDKHDRSKGKIKTLADFKAFVEDSKFNTSHPIFNFIKTN